MSSDNSFFFWQKWLFYTSLLFAAFGILFALYGENLVFKLYDETLARIFWNSAEIPAEVQPFRSFIYGPLGGTIACCYILLAYLAWYPFRKKERWARNAIILAFGTWVIIDSSLCIFYGVYFQAYLINVFSIIVKGLPLIFTWKNFKNNPA